MLGDGDVLRRGHDRHLRPDLVPDAREPVAHLISGQAQRRPACRGAYPFGARRRRDQGGRQCRGRRARPAWLRPSRAASSAAVHRSSLPPLDDAGPNLVAKAPGHVLSDLVAAGPDRRADDRRQARRRASARRPRRCRPRGLASLRGAPRAQAHRRSCGRARAATQSAPSVTIGTPGSSVQRPSPGVPREPACARFTIVEWVWYPSAAAPRQRRWSSRGAGGSRPRARRRLPCVRPRFSDSNGPSLTPPRRVEKTTSYGPGASHRRTGSAHPASTSSRAAASSDSRPSSSPFSLRRRSSARISPTRGDSPGPSSATSAPVISSRIPARRSK